MKKQTAIIVLILLLSCFSNAFGADKSRKGEGRRQGPPPEAFTACEGKKAGDTAEFTSPRGDTVSGTGEQDGDQLVLRPDQDSRGNHGRSKNSGKRSGQQGPPPEAFTACEGKEVGDTAELTSPRGDTISGTCEQDGDQLVLRPSNPPRSGKRSRSARK
ncbi:MAG: hypothetical protein D3923_14245 [Candidatus Electrothrix sp. AR3]|nr:hypothetical protein [Candidatus Electrothrix sp. AR3]